MFARRWRLRSRASQSGTEALCGGTSGFKGPCAVLRQPFCTRIFFVLLIAREFFMAGSHAGVHVHLGVGGHRVSGVGR